MPTFSPKKIGILGGSFNPIHLGHLLMAECALDQFHLEQILWIPAYRPVHKKHSLANFGHRWEMVQRAIADHPQFVASDIEYQCHISYASETFAQLKSLFPATNWHWIIGTDAFQSLPGWHSSVEWVAECIWLVAPRNQLQLDAISLQVEAAFRQRSQHLRWQRVQMPKIDLSSSLIRQYCQNGRSVRYLVPESVRVYINTNNLYQEFDPLPESGQISQPS